MKKTKKIPPLVKTFSVGLKEVDYPQLRTQLEKDIKEAHTRYQRVEVNFKNDLGRITRERLGYFIETVDRSGAIHFKTQLEALVTVCTDMGRRCLLIPATPKKRRPNVLQDLR